ncbi:hypothetical protein AB0K60_24475 [Thermopolyspora sp. NPDC052614]|uniref:hypothetical protein n=1 Tax=Thermopolyspora sp. NPDC052614 TaxID=3155682 RepID=UPI0034263E19
MLSGIQRLTDRVLTRLLPGSEAAATYQIVQYRCVTGSSGCDAYNHRWRQSRTCTYNDNGTVVSCTSWAYYACGC